MSAPSESEKVAASAKPNGSISGIKRKSMDESKVTSSKLPAIVDLDMLEDHIDILKRWIEYYDANWNEVDDVSLAQDGAEKALLGASKRVQNAREGIRLAIVGLMRSGKSSLLSTLINGKSNQTILPEMASTISTTMVPVEVGQNSDDKITEFSVDICFTPLKELRVKQRKLAAEVLEISKIPSQSSDDMDDDFDSDPPFDSFMDIEDSSFGITADSSSTSQVANDDINMQISNSASSESLNQSNDTFSHWIRSSRDGSFHCQNHPLKSLFLVLDQGGKAATSSMALARQLIEALASEDESVPLAPSKRDETGYSTQERLLGDDPDVSSIVTFTFNKEHLKDVHLLLFLLGIDHAAADYSIYNEKYFEDVEQVKSHVVNANDVKVQQLLDVLAQPIENGINSLWPLIDSIEVNCPATFWSLPPRLRLLDTAGLSSTFKDDGTIDINQSLMRKLNVNRLWMSTRSAAAGVGNVEKLATDVSRQILDLPLDVIITQIDSSNQLGQHKFDLEARNVTKSLTQANASTSNSPTRSRAFPVSTYWRRLEIDPDSKDKKLQMAKMARKFDQNYRSGFKELSQHLERLQNDQARLAQIYLEQAVETRAKLITQARNMQKFPQADTLVLSELIHKGIRLSITHLEAQHNLSADMMAKDLCDAVSSVPDSKPQVTVLLGNEFTTSSLYKLRDWRQIVAWIQKKDGELSDELSISRLVTSVYFQSAKIFAELVNDFLMKVPVELKRDCASLLKHVQESIKQMIEGSDIRIPEAQQIAVKSALDECSKIIDHQLSAVIKSVMHVLYQNIQALWQQSNGDVAQFIQEEIKNWTQMEDVTNGWRPTFSLSGKGIKKKLLEHIENFIKHHAQWFFSKCCAAFVQCLSPIGAWVADAKHSLLQSAISLIRDSLSAVWKPPPPEAFADLEIICKAIMGRSSIDKSQLNFMKTQSKPLLSPSVNPLLLCTNNLSSALGQTWMKEIIYALLPTGEKRVLLFRGLTTTVVESFNRARLGPYSPLYVPHEIVHSQDWSHVSSLALILFAHRRIQANPLLWAQICSRPLNQRQSLFQEFFSPIQLNPSSIDSGTICKTDLDAIGDKIREMMQSYMIQTRPPPNHPKSTYDPNASTWRNWWSKNSTSRKQEFSNLALPFQQLYSNDDKKFMLSFQHFIETYNLKGSALDRSIAHVSNWRKAAELTSWRWMNKLIRDDAEASKLQNPVLHTNPDVSMSKQLQHAMRYAVGLKNYAQGTQEGYSKLLNYGRTKSGIISSRQLDSNPNLAYSTLRHGEILGSIVVFGVPEETLSEPYVIDVKREVERNKLWADYHILHESEVCFYGLVPKSYQVFTHELKLLNFDDASIDRLTTAAEISPQETIAYEAYGMTKSTLSTIEGQAQLADLRATLLATVKKSSQFHSRGGEWQAEWEITIREKLGTLAFAALRQRLIDQGFTLPNTFVAEKVIRGTR